MKKNLLSKIAGIMAFSMLVTACGGGDASSKGENDTAKGVVPGEGPLGKYEEPLTITTIRSVNSSRAYVEGDTWEDNIWTRKIEEDLNIKFDYLWSCSSNEYESKLNMAIVSDDLPDMLQCPTGIFSKLASKGKLADLTEAYDKYASDLIKNNLAALDGIVLEQATFDGKIMGMGSTRAPDLSYLWYRDDWAANVGITEPPKTIDDVIDMAYKFVEGDPNQDGSKTVGFGMDKSFWGGGFNLRGLFSAYGANPTIWTEENGEIIYGGISEKSKAVLEKMQTWYRDGLIDQDFVNKGEWAEAPDDVVKGKIGMAFGPVWFGDWQTTATMKNFGEGATWTCMPVPDENGNPIKTGSSMTPAGFLCATKDFENPEAVVKLTNYVREKLTGETAEGDMHDVTDENGNNISTFFCAVDLLGELANDIYWNPKMGDLVTEALETGDESKMNAEAKSYYDRCKLFVNSKDPNGYQSYVTFAGETAAQYQMREQLEAENYTADLYDTANTELMDEKWSAILSKQDEIYTRIVMGSDLETEWDSWISFFESQGGPEITEEVKEYTASKK